MLIRNEDVEGLVVEVPQGHHHLRATVLLRDGTEIVFQEATMANLLRAYVTVKTHPTIERVKLKGTMLKERKADYAQWQLLEEGGETP